MPRVRSVSNIKANLLRPALTSAFEVELGIPNDLRRQLGARTDKLQLMCSEAVLPGSQLATTEVNNNYTGVTEKIWLGIRSLKTSCIARVRKIKNARKFSRA